MYFGRTGLKPIDTKCGKVIIFLKLDGLTLIENL
jgi:hypothetical protein